MELHEALLALEEPVCRLSGGINAIGVMSMGLSMAKDPYADGSNAVWDYMIDADRDLQKRVQICLELI